MRRTWLCGAAAMLAACGGGGDAGGSAPVTRDSAGIAIVENHGASWKAGDEWRVADSVLVDIAGDIDSVSGPVLLGDGRLAIANAGTHEVRVYDAAGAQVHASGRSGSGPGEYQMLAGIWRGPGDSLLVSDFLVRRVSVLDHEANFVRAFSLGGNTGSLAPTNGRIDFALPQGWLADGSIVGVTMSFTINQTREGRYRDTVSALRYGADGVVRDTIARFPGAEMEQMSMSLGGQSFSAPTAVPLGRQTVTAIAGDRLYVARNDTWEVEVRERDGKVARIIRLDVQPVPLTPEDIATHRKEQLEQLEAIPMMRNMPPAFKSQITARIEQAKYPDALPFIVAMLVDHDGNLWVHEVSRPGTKVSTYAVLDASGRLLGRVPMPERFRATSIESDRVYGVWKDEEDVEHIRAYRIRKGG